MDPLSIRSRAGVQSWQVTGSSSWQVTVSSICTLTTLADNELFSEEYSSCRFCWSAFDLRLFWPTSNIYIYIYIYGRYNDDNDMMTGGTVTLTCIYMWPTTSAWVGRQRMLGREVTLGSGGIDFSCWVNLLPAWPWFRVGLCAFAGFPLSLPSHA